MEIQKLITRNELKAIFDLNNAIEDASVNRWIDDAQELLRQKLGDAIYYNLITNYDTGKYLILLNGEVFEYSGNNIFFLGVKRLLAYYVQFIYLREAQSISTGSGIAEKQKENSELIDTKKIGAKLSVCYSNIAINYNNFLKYMSVADFSEWQGEVENERYKN